MKIPFVLLSAMALLASCGGSTSSSQPKAEEITDANGRKVMVTPGSYSKIVCIGAGALRMYSYVGATSLLAGVEDIDNPTAAGRPAMFDGVARPYFIANSEEYKKLPSCGKGGPQAQAAEAESILACRPDLVISEYENVDDANRLQEQLGVPVITLKYGSKGIFDQNAWDSIRLIGKVIGQSQKAETLVSYISNAKSDIEQRVSRLSSEKKTYICGLGQWGTTNHLWSAKNYEPFNVAHITNVCDGVLQNPGIQKLEEEVFASISSQIDVMILDAAAVKNIKPLYKENPNMFDGVKAWQNGEVYLQMAYNAYYTNLELALANTYFGAKAIYPEAFADIDMKAKTNEITTAFLGKAMADEIYAYPHSFGGYQKINVSTFFNE